MISSIDRIITVKAIWWLVLVALIALCSGCQSRQRWVGTWSGNRNLEVKEGDNPIALHTIGMISVEIFEDGRFEMFDSGMPKTGTVRIDGDVAHLDVKTIMGRSDPNLDTEPRLRWKDNGTVEFSDPKGFDRRPIVLTKESQPSSGTNRKE